MGVVLSSTSTVLYFEACLPSAADVTRTLFLIHSILEFFSPFFRLDEVVWKGIGAKKHNSSGQNQQQQVKLTTKQLKNFFKYRYWVNLGSWRLRKERECVCVSGCVFLWVSRERERVEGCTFLPNLGPLLKCYLKSRLIFMRPPKMNILSGWKETLREKNRSINATIFLSSFVDSPMPKFIERDFPMATLSELISIEADTDIN